ncbi:exodeoxyribonuclease X C-terminal domain-containing protein [Tepidibacter formicigenes]|uniref:exodeoxyribonuclease X C-terminal domain-containing protein n=1 Tax=Tepidibacter formicigenes TaxID=227138 RepID=UPI0038CD3961
MKDFIKIIEIIEKENIERNKEIIETVPDIIIPFGKYKGKSFKEIIEDKKYIEYLYKNTKNPNIKNASQKVL